MEPQIAFDTHAFVKRLTGAGMPETQAEIIAWGQARCNEHLATQPDLKALELTLKNDLEKVRAELKHDLEAEWEIHVLFIAWLAMLLFMLASVLLLCACLPFVSL